MRSWIGLVVVGVSLLIAGAAVSAAGGDSSWIGGVLSGTAIIAGSTGAFWLKRTREVRTRSDADDGVEAVETARLQAQVFRDALVVGTVVGCVSIVSGSPVNGAVIAFSLVVFMLADFGLRVVLARLLERREA
jgi:uncharacterized membrane protein YdjX (TVP38/TMEM64 family)